MRLVTHINGFAPLSARVNIIVFHYVRLRLFLIDNSYPIFSIERLISPLLLFTAKAPFKGLMTVNLKAFHVAYQIRPDSPLQVYFMPFII